MSRHVGPASIINRLLPLLPYTSLSGFLSSNQSGPKRTSRPAVYVLSSPSRGVLRSTGPGASGTGVAAVGGGVGGGGVAGGGVAGGGAGAGVVVVGAGVEV